VTPGTPTTTSVCFALPSGSPLQAGTYQSSITATSGSLVHTLSMPIDYIGDYQLGPSSSSLYVTQGGTNAFQLTATSYDGFIGWIYLSSSSNGYGISTSMSSSMYLNPGYNYGMSWTSITVIVSGSTPVGTYTLTIQGTFYAANNYPVTRSTSLTVYVQSPGSGGGGGGGGGPPRPCTPTPITSSLSPITKTI
jgi:hypothetical protein